MQPKRPEKSFLALLNFGNTSVIVFTAKALQLKTKAFRSTNKRAAP
jgi:hypothetical protein